MSVSKSDMGIPIAPDDLANVAVDGAPLPPGPREAVAEAMAKCDCPEWDMSQHPPESLGRRLFHAKTDALIAALSRRGFRVVRQEVWRPIETCPTEEMVWVWQEARGVLQSKTVDGVWLWSVKPTHWQPIVKPEGPQG